MNKKTIRIAGWALGLSMAVAGIGLAVGAAQKAPIEAKAAVNLATEEVNYSLAMKCNNSDSDSSTALSVNTPGSYINTGASYVTSVSSGYCYLGKSSLSSLKFGSSSKKGTITFTLAAAGQVKATNVVFRFGAYDTNKTVKFSLNGATSGTGYGTANTPATQGNFTDYALAWDGATDLTSITIEANNQSSNRFYLQSITVYTAKSVDPETPAVSITNANKIAPHGVARALSAAITNDDSYTITWSCANPNVTLSSSTGANITITASDSIVAGTVITITATLNDEGSATDYTSFYVASKAGDSVANALPAGEAKTLVATGDFDGDTLYVKGYSNNSGAKLVWLSDNPDSTKSFEIYNASGLSSYNDGTFIVAHGSALKYNATSEVTGGVVDSADYFVLSASSAEVNNTQYVDITATGATGDISWEAADGTGSVSLSNKTNDGVRITGTSVGTATVTATVGNLVKTITVTVNAYATDWAFKDITLEASGSFKDEYEIGEELDISNLTVTYIEHSDTLGEDRETVVTTNPGCTFNFDSSDASVFNLTATYNGHTTDDVVGVTILEGPAYETAFGTNNDGVFTTTAGSSASGVQTKYETKAFNGLEWTLKTVSTNNKTVRVTSGTTNIQIGVTDYPAASFSLRSNVFGSAKTKITAVKIVTYGAAGTSAATLSVSADEGSFTCNSKSSVSLSGTTPTTPYEFVSSGAYGHITIDFASVAKGYKIDSIVVYAAEDLTDKGAAYAFASKVEAVNTCDASSKTALINEYNNLSPSVKALADAISLYDRPDCEDDDYGATYKTKSVTVGNKMAYLIANNSGGGGLGLAIAANGVDDSNLPVIITVASLGILTAGGLFLVQRKRRQD